MMIRTAIYGSAIIEYSLAFSARRSLAISVLPDGAVAVTAPVDADPCEVDERVKRRARWILRQQRRFAEFRPRTPSRRFVGGETHRYLGRQYRLKVEPADADRVVLRAGRLVVATRFPEDPDWTRTLVRRWMRERAHRVLQERFHLVAGPLAAALKIKMPPLRICPMQKRWGSHTPSGRVILNDALIAAPRDCIDYVVAHELCHVVEPNHSPGFLRLLRRFIPDWQRRKELLERSTA
ncbi:MAG TPA: SprT family zinc-dependent metalloprotease [Stellaceae bacterium]|nr:SprT family zinc-dependent metalloprotease [Stellaceae bacterium]